ncbi:MAG TPA: hypothetical protein VMU57_21405 [Edaphobacter sp.]|nr:hypothetical protein [Edaphobacter sp.]HUZ97471.1 hypothetical protein [Edaphobacter sp.]
MRAVERLHADVPRLGSDRVLSGDIERVAALISAGEFCLLEFSVTV